MKRSGQRLDLVKPPCCRSPYGATGTSSHHAGHVHCASVHEQQQLCKQQRRAAQQAAEAVWSSNSRAGEQADAAGRDSRAAAAGQAGVPSIVHQAQTADKQGQCSGGTKAAGRQQGQSKHIKHSSRHMQQAGENSTCDGKHSATSDQSQRVLQPQGKQPSCQAPDRLTKAACMPHSQSHASKLFSHSV